MTEPNEAAETHRRAQLSREKALRCIQSLAAENAVLREKLAVAREALRVITRRGQEWARYVDGDVKRLSMSRKEADAAAWEAEWASYTANEALEKINNG